MDIDEYLKFVSVKLKDAHTRNDKEEFLRLLGVLRDTVDDTIKNIAGSAT